MSISIVICNLWWNWRNAYLLLLHWILSGVFYTSSNKIAILYIKLYLGIALSLPTEGQLHELNATAANQFLAWWLDMLRLQFEIHNCWTKLGITSEKNLQYLYRDLIKNYYIKSNQFYIGIVVTQHTGKYPDSKSAHRMHTHTQVRHIPW